MSGLATGALKLLGESYPFAPGGACLLTADNHNSAKAPVDRLVRHVETRIVRKGLAKPPRNLLRRPVQGELLCHQEAQEV